MRRVVDIRSRSGKLVKCHLMRYQSHEGGWETEVMTAIGQRRRESHQQSSRTHEVTPSVVLPILHAEPSGACNSSRSRSSDLAGGDRNWCRCRH